MDYTREDIAWARRVLTSPEQTAAVVRAFKANPNDLDAAHAVLFLHEVLNGRIA